MISLGAGCPCKRKRMLMEMQAQNILDNAKQYNL
jgi:hypothetical protein